MGYCWRLEPTKIWMVWIQGTIQNHSRIWVEVAGIKPLLLICSADFLRMFSCWLTWYGAELLVFFEPPMRFKTNIYIYIFKCIYFRCGKISLICSRSLLHSNFACFLELLQTHASDLSWLYPLEKCNNLKFIIWSRLGWLFTSVGEMIQVAFSYPSPNGLWR